MTIPSSCRVAAAMFNHSGDLSQHTTSRKLTHSTSLFTLQTIRDAVFTGRYKLSEMLFSPVKLTKLSSTTGKSLTRITNLLSAPFVRTSFGSRSFSVAAHKIWNSLPPSLRTCTSPDTFRRHLKTHYCQQAFQST